MNERRHEIARAWMTFQHAMRLAPNASVDGVNQPIAHPAGRVLQKSAGQDRLAVTGESHLDPSNHTSRFSATPSPSWSVSFQICGGAAT